MKIALFQSIKLSFVLVVISSLIWLAMYSSLTSPKNSLYKNLFDITLQVTEEEEERTVREVPEADLYVDYVATSQLNQKAKPSGFPLYLELDPQEYSPNFKKPPRS